MVHKTQGFCLRSASREGFVSDKMFGEILEQPFVGILLEAAG